MLLGRWTLIAQRHGGGCSCCPGLGEVAIEEVEKRVSDWLRLPCGFTAVLRDCIAGRGALNEALHKDLTRSGFKFVGPTICYAFMQAVGLVNDHDHGCFRYREISGGR